MINYQQTIMSQFSNSPTIVAILTAFNEAMSTESDIEQFYNNFFNVETAVGVGLDIWGIIVGVPRRIKVESTGKVIGFNYDKWDGSGNWTPFSVSPWFGGYAIGLVEVSDVIYRRLIIAKAAANISTGTIPDINKFLTIYSKGRGIAYARDNYDWTVDYIFKYPIDDFDKAILTNKSISPSVAGVSINIIQETN